MSASNLTNKAENYSDSIRISLLTCSPHDEIYSLYGHTAIRYEDPAKGIDVAINYGVFSFHQPYFVLRFVFGITDYQIGIEEFSDFRNEYKSYGSSVIQQTLNLSSEEKTRFLEALTENCTEENRTYRYNYFYNNCTTKARDLLISSISGKVIYKNRIDGSCSFRKMIHSCNESHRWARFGNDMLLGINADRNTSREDQQFLPVNLLRDFSSAYIINSNGTTRPLVYKTKKIIDTSNSECNENAFTPTFVSIAFFFLVVLMCITELITRKRFGIFDTIIQIALGCIGVLLFIMIFSEHPATSINLQILLFNPIFIYIAFSNIRNRNTKSRLKINYLISSVFTTCAILGSFMQAYAEGITILASCLLFRYLINYIRLSKE